MGARLGPPRGVVHWGIVGNTVTAWVLTLPAAGLLGALAYGGSQVPANETVGVIVVALLASVFLAGLYLRTVRKDHVTSHNILAAPQVPPRRPAPVGAHA
jgi:PiT family inorganic phosphate transporter